MEARDIVVDEAWSHILRILPRDLEESARQTGCVARLRNVGSSADLLRVMLVYGVSDLSLKDTAAWAKACGIAQFTAPALFYRLEQTEAWLERILGQLLFENMRAGKCPFEIRIIDGTVITGPGSRGTDWVVHVVINAVSGYFESVQITDARGAETFLRHKVNPGEVVLGDRMYATARGIESVVDSGAYPLVRVNRRTLKICDLDKQRIYLQSFEPHMTRGQMLSLDVLIPTPPDMTGKRKRAWDLTEARSWIPARIVGLRTEKDVIWVLTTASRTMLSDEAILKLYRLRWQVELLFKRLKSLLHLDALPTRNGPISKSWLLIRLIGAALAQILASPSGIFSPPRRRPGVWCNSQHLVSLSRDTLGGENSDTRKRSLASGNQSTKPRRTHEFQAKASYRLA